MFKTMTLSLMNIFGEKGLTKVKPHIKRGRVEMCTVIVIRVEDALIHLLERTYRWMPSQSPGSLST